MTRKRLSRVIRIFISSTFIDMERERALLHANVFPALKELCETHGWSFETIDLRWGITAEEAYDNRTVEICINEIVHSRQISPRPNFIILAGQRYGWIPLPDKLPQAVFEALRAEVPDGDRHILDRFYIPDSNSIEPVYILTKGSGSNAETEKCRKILADFAASHPEFEKSYLISATESEIYEGLFKEPELKENVLLYVRSLTDIPADKREIFCQGEQRQRDLNDRLRNYVHEKDSFSIESTYENFALGENDNRFIARMTELLTRQILEEIERYRQLDSHSEELLLQEEEVECRGKNYPLLCGTADVVFNALNISRVVVINGSSNNDSGAMAAYIARSCQRSVIRYAAISPCSDSAESILCSIFYELSGKHPQNKSGVPLLREVSRYLSEIDEPLTIVISNVDRLPSDNSLLSLMWLPPAFRAPNIKVVLLGEDEPLNIQHDKDIAIVELPAINADPVRNTVYKQLHQKGRRLSESQRAAADRLIANNNSDLPQNIDLLVRHLQKVNCDATIDSSILFPDSFWQEICSPHNNHPLFARLTLALICAVPGGVTDSEILEILATDPELYSSLNEEYGHRIVSGGSTRAIPMSMWSKLYFQLAPMLSASAGISASKHRIAYPSATRTLQAFLGDDARRRVLRLAKNYFMAPERYESYRACELLPSLMLLLGESDEASDILCDDSFCNRKISLGMFDGLKTDFKNTLSAVPSPSLATRLQFLISEEPTLVQYCFMSPRFFKRQFSSFSEENHLSVGPYKVLRRRLLRQEEGAVVTAFGDRLLIVENFETFAECTLYQIATMNAVAWIDIPLNECIIKRRGAIADRFFAEIKGATISSDGTMVGMTCGMGRALKWNVTTNELESFPIEQDDMGDAYCSSPVFLGYKLAYSVTHSNKGESIRIDSEIIFSSTSYNHFEHLFPSSDGSILYAVSHLYLEYITFNLITNTSEKIILKDPDLSDWTTLLGYDRNTETLYYRGTDALFPIGAMDMKNRTAATCSGDYAPSDYVFSVLYSQPLDLLIIALKSKLTFLNKKSGEVIGIIRSSDSSSVRLLPLGDDSFLCIGKDIVHYRIS